MSFFLSFLVVLVHVHSFDSYSYTGALGSVLKSISRFLTNGLTFGAIRLFFLISGVLFYRNYTYSRTGEKLKSRFRSLVLPYLLWCTLYTALFMVAGKTPIRNTMAIDMTLSVKNIVCGILLNQYYKSFWFILDLIVFTLFCPVIYTLLKNKIVGLITIAAVTVLYAFGITIPETIQIGGVEYVAFWRADSIVLYLIGAFIGIHCFDWFAARKSRLTAVLALVVYVLCSFLRSMTKIQEIPALWILMMICCSFAIWNMFDLCEFGKKNLPGFISYSFMMFALNFYLGVYISKVLYLILPKAQIFSLVNLVITLVLELGFILGLSHILRKKAPKLYGLLTGGR